MKNVCIFRLYEIENVLILSCKQLGNSLQIYNWDLWFSSSWLLCKEKLIKRNETNKTNKTNNIYIVWKHTFVYDVYTIHIEKYESTRIDTRQCKYRKES